MSEVHEIRLDEDGALDEVLAANASVHIERMSDHAFWIGIGLPNDRQIMVNTGVENGKWFFNVEEDWQDGRTFGVEESVGGGE